MEIMVDTTGIQSASTHKTNIRINLEQEVVQH